MLFGTIISSPRDDLPVQQALHLASFYLENARNETDPDVALLLCYNAEISLSHLKRAKHGEDAVVREGVATVYAGLGDLMDSYGHQQEAQVLRKKSEKWG